MNTYFLEYRDPLFGIMAFLLIAFIVSVGVIIASKIKSDKQASGVKRFLQNFPTKNEKDYAQLLEAHPDSFELLSNVAKTYFDGGDYEKSLKIYLALLEWVSPFSREKKAHILEAMGDIYTKSGFLQRSMEAYERSLSILPRNQSALRKVVLIYDKRSEFDKALEAIDALEELGADEVAQKGFLSGMSKLKKAASANERVEILGELSVQNPFFAREYLRELLASDISKAVGFLEENESGDFIDILWSTELKELSAAKSKSVILSAVLDAKGISAYDGKSGVFELDAVRAIKHHAEDLNADLSFEFVCQKCGNIDIDYFFSCKSCGTVGGCKVVPSISKRYDTNPLFLDSW